MLNPWNLAGIVLLSAASALVAQTSSPSGATGFSQGFGGSTGGAGSVPVGQSLLGITGSSLGSSVGATGNTSGSSVGGMPMTGQGGLNLTNPAFTQSQAVNPANSRLGAGTGNLLSPYYANPLYAGWPGNVGKDPGGWGVPLYQASTVGTGGFAGSTFGGLSGLGGPGFANISNFSSGAAAIGGVRRPAYVSTLVFPVRTIPSGQMQIALRDIVKRSSALSQHGDVQVHVDGQTVVLSGEVADDRERRLVEGMVRLTPGVREVRNELQTRQLLPPPRLVPE